MKILLFRLAPFAILLMGVCVAAGQEAVSKLRSAGTIIDAGPYSFPEKVRLDRFGNLYILDSALSNVFVGKVSGDRARVSPLCSPRTPVRAADLSVEGSGGIWILDSGSSRIVKLDRNCKVQRSFVTRRTALALQVTSTGEIAVLTSTGETLFDLYDQSGTLLRSFGQRLSYGNPIADSELSNGHLVADRMGGFYFSFNYPPLVRHYRRDGTLLREFKPESNIFIGSPNVTSERQGGRLAVRSDYRILVLDMTIDERGRLIFLLSGKTKTQAIRQGSQNLLVTSNSGRVLRKAAIEETSFHRLVAGRSVLYLLRNRDGLRLDKYDLP